MVPRGFFLDLFGQVTKTDLGGASLISGIDVSSVACG
jgi:hypothetical protein